MDYIIYVLIIIIGLLYLMFAAFTNFDFLIGNYSLGIPYGLLGWGITGILSSSEPFSFILGFCVPFLVIGTLYTYLTTSGSNYEKLLFKEGEVTIPILPNKIGEIRINRGNGFDFLMAKANNIIKPIPKKEKVRIIDLDSAICIVTTDYENIEPTDFRSEVYHYLYMFIRLITPKPRISGVCMICYGGMNRVKNGIQCPECKSVAHRDHLEEWLKIKGKCPNCRTELEFKGRKLIKSSY